MTTKYDTNAVKWEVVDEVMSTGEDIRHIPIGELPVLFEDYKPKSYKPTSKTLVAPIDWTLECRNGTLRLLINNSEKAWAFMEDMNIPCSGILNNELDVFALTPEQLTEFVSRLNLKRAKKTNGYKAPTAAQIAARRANAKKARERKKK